MLARKILQTTIVVAITGGLLSVAQPALALSSAPDLTWGVNGKVFATARSGNTLFVGGTFKKALGPSGQKVTVSNLAAFDVTTGALVQTFVPTVDLSVTTDKPEVDALAVSSDGSKLYIGGNFDTVDGQYRLNFAAVDAATGSQLDPNVTVAPNLRVQAIVATAGLVYFGGNFDKVDGLDRLHLAAISATTGALSSTWVPSSTAGTDPCPSLLPPGTSCGPTSNGGSGNIHSMALAPGGNGLFVGGNFFYVNGVPRNALAEVSTVNGSLVNWRVKWATIPSESNSNPYQGPNVVWAIVPTSTAVFIGYGRTPNGIERYTMSTSSSSGECAAGGCATSLWTRSTPGNAESLALSPDGTRLFAGGHFGTAVLDYKISPPTCPSTVWVHGLLSLNPTNGAVFCDWFPQIVPFGGQSAPGSGVNPPNYVGAFTMQITSNALFVGGYFTSISGVTQSGWARFTLSGSPPPPPPLPTITSFSPTSGPVGSTVTVTGTGFTGATAVSFGATPATSFTVVSDTQITAVVPGGFAHAPIKVTTPGGTAKSSTNFVVTSPPSGPTITSFSPTSGPVGTSVTITGTGFTGATGVSFGATPAVSFTVDSDAQITAVVPAGAATGPIAVTTSGGTGTSATSFVVASGPVPTITSFDPASGPVGTAVTITGTGFTGATGVSFGASPAASFTVDSDTQITAVVPVGAGTSPIKVTTPNGTATSATNFKVLIVVSSFTPTLGPVGTTVTITGSGFTGASGVSFGSTPAASFTVNSDTQITTTVPAGAVTAPIKVSVPGNGVGKSTTNFKVTVLAVSGLSPSSGTVGDQVIISGSGFTGATQVQFNGVDATFSVDSDSQITAFVPAGATSGFVTVTTPNGTAQSGSTFTVT